MKEENGVQVTLTKICADLEHIKSTMSRVEDFAYSMNKRLQDAENQISYIKGGFFVLLQYLPLHYLLIPFF